MEYSLVTLVGNRKIYSAPKFWNYIQKLNDPPARIFVSCTEETFKKFSKSYSGLIPLTWLHGNGDMGNSHILSTTAAREVIRKEVIKLPYDWTLWLDSDILVPHDIIEKFEVLLEKNPKLIWVNGYHPARQEGGDAGRTRHGLASSFIHRDLLEGVPFFSCTIRGMTTGDDYIWKDIAGCLARPFELTILRGIYFDVGHALKDGSIHEFTSEQRTKMDREFKS